MKDILQLVRSGKLGEATARILASLRGDRAAPRPAGTSADPADDSAVDGVASRVDEVAAATIPAAAETRSRTGKVETLSYASPIGAISCRLYVPDTLPGESPPLLLMLHGCTQNPDDFARGTRMDEQAGAEGYVVVYPGQTTARNLNRCWNWFDPSNHAPGVGEAAALAALTEAVAEAHGVDRHRIFVAGLSAGGAMAVNLGTLYPRLFAAVGVHSGLPFASARDIPSAFAAMQRGGQGRAAARDGTNPVPTIAFYGDADHTVSPANGRAIVDDLLVAAGNTQDPGKSKGTTASEESVVGSAIRTVHRRKDGSILAEEWRVRDGGHAWYGGDKSGSFTQPGATDASSRMLAFFRTVAAQAQTPDRH